MKPPFSYVSMKSTSGRLLSVCLSGFYGAQVALRLTPKIFRHRSAFFAVKDREGAYRPKVLDAYGSHQSVHLPKSNIKLHYVSAGDKSKPLMLFVHGFPECWFTWRHQMTYKPFTSQYHTVAVSMRGYGDSDRPVGVKNYSSDLLYEDIVGVINYLVTPENPKCVLVSHDWGGVVAWNVAQRRPDLVHRFVALNAPHPKAWQGRLATSWSQFRSSWYMFFFNLPLLPELFLRNRDFKALDNMFGKHNRGSGEMDVYKHYFAKPYGVEGPLNYYRAMLRGYGVQQGGPERKKSSTKSSLVEPKTLILWGEDDDALISELATDSAALCKDAQVKYLPNCSHWIQVHKPKEVNEAMEEFLEKSK